MINYSTSILSLVQEEIRGVEQIIRSQADGYNPELHTAVNLLLAAGGKRIRPTITILTGRLLFCEENQLLILASAIELLHTATLVHDDLIDGSLLRRGNATLNARWSPAATVLTGDFLFARAAMLVADTDSIPANKMFARTLSIIVNGEIDQLFDGQWNTKRDTYYKRIYAKTASLFETAAATAALIAPVVNPSVVEQMRLYGHEIGMAFQIIDDLLDFTANTQKLGKPVGSDLHQGLVTLPAIYYFEQHPDHPAHRAILDGNYPGDEQLNLLIEAIRNSDVLELAHKEARQFASNAIQALESLPTGTERSALEEIAEYIVDRDY